MRIRDKIDQWWWGDKILYEGRYYFVRTREFGYTSRLFIVNGEEGTIMPYKYELDTHNSYKQYTEKAIREYITNQRERDLHKQWIKSMREVNK